MKLVIPYVGFSFSASYLASQIFGFMGLEFNLLNDDGPWLTIQGFGNPGHYGLQKEQG